MKNIINLTNNISEPVEEALRTLRTNIQFCSAEKQVKTICVTSCIPHEGKTMTSINISISIASANKKVVYIDADMRKPRQFKKIASKYNAGLANYLSGMAELDDIIRETSIDNLHMIVCGPKPPNPAELLGTARFLELLEKLKERYDYIVIDTPPLGSMIDAAIIAAAADGTIMIVKYNTIDYRKALKVKEQLEKANARIMGVVLNRIPKKEYKDYYYYDYDYHYRQSAKKYSDSKEIAD